MTPRKKGEGTIDLISESHPPGDVQNSLHFLQTKVTPVLSSNNLHLGGSWNAPQEPQVGGDCRSNLFAGDVVCLSVGHCAAADRRQYFCPHRARGDPQAGGGAGERSCRRAEADG